MAYARRLHAAHPGLTLQHLSRLSRAAASHLKPDAAFKEIPAELAAIDEETPKTEGEANIAYARRLHAAHPGLSLAHLSRLSRAKAGTSETGRGVQGDPCGAGGDRRGDAENRG